jgi:hypothetical protein
MIRSLRGNTRLNATTYDNSVQKAGAPAGHYGTGEIGRQ